MALGDELKAQILRYHFVEHWRVGTIARQLGVHHSTVERVLGEAGVQRERRRPRRPSKLETLEHFPTLTAARVFDMVKARGYTGGPDHFRHRIAQLRPRRVREAYPYLAFITETLEHFPTLTAARVFDMVKARGYPGGPDHFRHRIAQLRPRRRTPLSRGPPAHRRRGLRRGAPPPARTPRRRLPL